MGLAPRTADSLIVGSAAHRMGPDGPVAQLGARVNGIHEVAGSIPAWSTNFPLRPASLLSR